MFKRFSRLTLEIVGLVNTVRGGENYTQNRMRKAYLSRGHLRTMGEAAQFALSKELMSTGLECLSLRLGTTQMGITAAEANYGDMGENDIRVVAINKPLTDELAPVSTPWHQRLYDHVPDAKGAIICTPMHGIVALRSEMEITRELLPIVYDTIGGIANAADEEAFAALAPEHHVVGLPSGLVLAWGESTTNAVRRAASFEIIAQIGAIAQQTQQTQYPHT